MLDASAPYAELIAAAERSRLTGFTWVLQIGHHEPAEAPAGPIAALARTRAEAAGLWPYVIGVTYGEEWHERCRAGKFAYLGLTEGHPACGSIVYDYLSRQIAAVDAVTGGLPVLWITHLVYPGAPVPVGVDYVGLDPYPVDGESWQDFEPLLLISEHWTPLPLVLVPRWFRATGPFQGEDWRKAKRPVSAEIIDGYARFAARPSVVAVLGFLWASRPYADLVGLADLPSTRAAVARSLGVW